MSRPDYALRRTQAYGLAEQEAARGNPPIHVQVTGIDAGALAAFAETWAGHHWSGYGGMDWVQIWYRLVRQEHRNFHCALWHGSVLCGLGIGSVPRGHSFLTIRIIEGRPQGHPLKGHVARITLAAARYYARGLLLPQVRLENPAPALENWYRKLGFTIAYREGVVRYLAMDLRGDEAQIDQEPIG